VVDLTVQLLAARCGVAFGRGFRLRAIGQQLYVQITGRKVPLYLAFDADPQQVQERANALRRFLEVRLGRFDTESWKELCWGSRVRKGKNEKPRLDLEEVSLIWGRFKRAEGISEDTLERHYMSHLRRLDLRHPLSEESLLGVIERTDPRSPTRRRVVAFLRRLCALCGTEWNGALLDPLQNAGRSVQHRPQSFFTDAEIEAMLAPNAALSPSWRRVVAVLAIYGLRPWEAWVVEPCSQRAGCAWVGSGKTNRHGTTTPRQVPPFHAKWLERFGMEALWQEPLPGLGDPSKAGARVNQQLRRCALVAAGGATSYGFRHAYARRLHSPRYRVTDAHASLFMGHTVAAHHKAYRNWLGGEDPIGLYLDCPG
jgi:integrase